MNDFYTTRRVEFVDTDMAGIVHFSNFFRFMEAAEVEFLRHLGASVVLNWEGEDLGFPRVSASCDYMRPAFFQDVLDIVLTVHKVGQKSITYRHEFTRNGEVIARGQITGVCCRHVPGQPLQSIEIPASLRALLERGKAE